MELFFYGTLLDPDVRRLVLGAEAQFITLRPAVLMGYRRYRSCGGDYPVVRRCSGGRVAGALAGSLGREALMRIGHFEGQDYVPVRLQVSASDGRPTWAWVYMAQLTGIAAGRTWTLRGWQTRSKTALLPKLKRWSKEFGAETLQSADIPWHVRRRIRELAED